MSSSIALRTDQLSKCYRLYDHPKDRLKQFFVPRLQQMVGGVPTHYFREFWALRDVALNVERGETVGIIGRNGSGKSTLLQLLCGTLTPTAGTIDVNGQIAALLELGAGFHPEFTGRENVYMNGALLGMTRNEIDERFDDIAAFAEIGELLDQPVKTYSSGMYVRLAFAVIAHVRADILVIDEALAVGDAFFVQKCMRFLRSFRETGTIILVTHDTGAVVSFCTRALWLDCGKIQMDGSPKSVCQAYLASRYNSKLSLSFDHGEAPACAEHQTLQPSKDQRLDFINQSIQRNDLEVFKFDPAASSFGNGVARIVHVGLFEEYGAPLAWVVGGERVIIRIRVKALQDVSAPIIGFVVQDRLGQVLFGDNTYLTYRDRPLSVQLGEEVEGQFTFQMPILPVGEYPLAVAVADGTQMEHVQHHWIHDALVIRSHASSTSTGLVGLPMQDISMQVLRAVA
ncbi:MAG: ABC transporter ATP-binding protein [Nitrospirota bacterium]